MEYVTPEKNEAGFLRWQKERRWLIGVFWAILSLFVITAYSVILIMHHEGKITLRELPKIMVEGNGIEVTREEMIGLVALSVLYVIVLIIIRQCYIKWRLGQLSKEACIFAAIVAAEDLDRGNPVRACLSMDRLLLALSDFLGQKLVTLGVSSASPTDIMHITPEAIPRRAVSRAIEASPDTKDFQERLCNLAIRLRDDGSAGYPAAHQFLVWLNRKVEAYREGFLERHPSLRIMARNVAPIALPPLAVIVIEILRQTG